MTVLIGLAIRLSALLGAPAPHAEPHAAIVHREHPCDPEDEDTEDHLEWDDDDSEPDAAAGCSQW